MISGWKVGRDANPAAKIFAGKAGRFVPFLYTVKV